VNVYSFPIYRFLVLFSVSGSTESIMIQAAKDLRIMIYILSKNTVLQLLAKRYFAVIR